MQKQFIAFFFLLAVCFTSFLAGQRMRNNPESQVTRAMELIMVKRQLVFDYKLFAKDMEAEPESVEELINTDKLKRNKNGR